MVLQRTIMSLVGLFILMAGIACMVLVIKVSGLTRFFPEEHYLVTAVFDEVAGLKVRAPVKIAGVQIGEVSKIVLDPLTFKAIVSLEIKEKYNDIPDDSAATILTAGLLGDNYIALTPMYSKTTLKNGGQIQLTHSAMVLEKLIGQLIYKLGNNNEHHQGSAQ